LIYQHFAGLTARVNLGAAVGARDVEIVAAEAFATRAQRP
jgi:hypothetical protein